jgi:hypothetical protein
MHSVVDWFAYAVWIDGQLRRSLSLSPDSGIMEIVGTEPVDGIVRVTSQAGVGSLAVRDPYAVGQHHSYRLAKAYQVFRQRARKEVALHPVESLIVGSPGWHRSPDHSRPDPAALCDPHPGIMTFSSRSRRKRWSTISISVLSAH